MSQPEEQPFSNSHLDSPEYRKRLLRKLNTLIAVLEVACAKVRRSLQGANPDIERLSRIQKNLKETLQVCQRAKRALARCEKNATAKPELPARVAQGQSVGQEDPNSDHGHRRFERLGPIDLREVRACDLDALCQQLMTDLS